MSELRQPLTELTGSGIDDITEALQAARVSHLESVERNRKLSEVAKKLAGREGWLSGLLTDMDGKVVYPDNPDARVVQCHVKIGSAWVEKKPSRPETSPYLTIMATTVLQGIRIRADLLTEGGAHLELIDDSPQSSEV